MHSHRMGSEVVVKALRLVYTSHFSQIIDSEVSHLI